MAKEEEFDILFNRIEASLRYGAIRLPKKLYTILVVSSIICSALSIILLFVAIYDEPLAFLGTAIFLFVLLIIIIIFLHFYKLKNKIKLWLEDSIEIKAKCSTLIKVSKKKKDNDNDNDNDLLMLGAVVTTVGIGLATGTDIGGMFIGVSPEEPINSRINVTFKHNGKVLKKMSGKQGYSADEMETGRNPIFKKFIGKEIDILFSPKYDQVLLLKIQNPVSKDTSNSQ